MVSSSSLLVKSRANLLPAEGSAAIDLKTMTLNRSMIQAAKPVTAPAPNKPLYQNSGINWKNYDQGKRIPVPDSVKPAAPVVSSASRMEQLMSKGANLTASERTELQKLMFENVVRPQVNKSVTNLGNPDNIIHANTPQVFKTIAKAGTVITGALLGAGAAKLIKDRKMQTTVKPLDSVKDELKESARGIVTGTTGALNDSINEAKESLRGKIANLINPQQVTQAGTVPRSDNKMFWIVGILLAILALTRIK